MKKIKSRKLLGLMFSIPLTLSLFFTQAAVAAMPPAADQQEAAQAQEPMSPRDQARALKKARPSKAFPFESRFIEVNGDKIHYIDEGEGDPVLFVHGVPDSSHTWRNVIPHVKPRGRVIALDLPGMGLSDKPSLQGYNDLYDRFEGFIEALELKNVTLVVIDWGAILGLQYARTHEDNVRGVVMMEAAVAPLYPIDDPEAFRRMGSSAASALDFYQTMKTPMGEELIVNQNAFIETIMPDFVVRKMRKRELDIHRQAYADPQDRYNLLMFPRMMPIEGQPADTQEVFVKNNEWLLSKTKTPTMLIWFRPGLVVLPEQAKWLAEYVTNHENVYGGIGLHFVQEDEPDAIGYAVAEWLRRHK